MATNLLQFLSDVLLVSAISLLVSGLVFGAACVLSMLGFYILSLCI